MADFPTLPLFGAPLVGEHIRISRWNYPTKTRGMGLLYGENFMILSSTFFIWITRVAGRARAKNGSFSYPPLFDAQLGRNPL